MQARTNGGLIGRRSPNEQIEISVNGERAALLDISPTMSESSPGGLNLKTTRIFVKAGPQRISAAFLPKFSGLAMIWSLPSNTRWLTPSGQLSFIRFLTFRTSTCRSIHGKRRLGYADRRKFSSAVPSQPMKSALRHKLITSPGQTGLSKTRDFRRISKDCWLL